MLVHVKHMAALEKGYRIPATQMWYMLPLKVVYSILFYPWPILFYPWNKQYILYH
jgi:hypothetical protein